MSTTNLDTNSTVSSSSTEDTESTHTQSGFVSPPIRASFTIDNLANNHQSNHLTANPLNAHQRNPHTAFRKCRSFIHLSKCTDRAQTSLIDSGNSDRVKKSASTPTAIYMAIKQEHHFLVYRIFNRCKVNVILILFCFVVPIKKDHTHTSTGQF